MSFVVDLDVVVKVFKLWFVLMGIKVFMNEGEYLLLVNCFSNFLKCNLILLNGIGVIDVDYYNNFKNEGVIFV